jgi:hypothetical protein
VEFGAEAKRLWEQVYADLSEGRPGLLGAIVGRAEAHVVRLGLIYNLLDCSETIGAAGCLGLSRRQCEVHLGRRHRRSDRG